jgi:Flp pilus assembly protein TadG
MSRYSEGGATRQTLLARIRDERGQGTVELGLMLPFLLLFFCGVVELGRMLETNHIMASLTREGANLASRGATMAEALAATRANQAASGLGSVGGAVISRVIVDADSVPRVESRIASEGYTDVTRVADTDSIASVFSETGLQFGHSYYVVELFIPFEPVTPLRRFMSGLIPEEMYDRSIF